MLQRFSAGQVREHGALCRWVRTHVFGQRTKVFRANWNQTSRRPQCLPLPASRPAAVRACTGGGELRRDADQPLAPGQRRARGGIQTDDGLRLAEVCTTITTTHNAPRARAYAASAPLPQAPMDQPTGRCWRCCEVLRKQSPGVWTRTSRTSPPFPGQQSCDCRCHYRTLRLRPHHRERYTCTANDYTSYVSGHGHVGHGRTEPTSVRQRIGWACASLFC